MEEDNVATRLKGFISAQGITNSQFADTCGIPRPSLSQLLSGRNKKISDVLVGQIHHAYPEMSILWLMFGEGKMLRSEEAEAPRPQQEVAENGGMGILPGMNEQEPENIPAYGRTESVYSNVSALKQQNPTHKYAENKEVKADMEMLELQRQIDKMKKNPRKVSHITVYYDDSTFETFYPKR